MRINQTKFNWRTGLFVSLFFLFITITGIFDFTDVIDKEFNTFTTNIFIKGHFIRPPWIPFLEFFALIVSCLYITFLLPRLKPGLGTAGAAGLFAVNGITFGWLLLFSNIWFKTIPSAFVLIVGSILIIPKLLLNIDRATSPLEEECFGNTGKHTSMHPEEDKDLICRDAPGKEVPTAPAVDGGKNVLPIIGGYRVVKKLRHYPIGVVCEGVKEKTGQRVLITAIQLKKFDEDVEEDVRAHFFREAEALSLLTHPNIVPVCDWGEDKGIAYNVLEYFTGKSLKEYTRKGRLLPIREVLSVVSQLADALEHAHRNHIVFQNITPANGIVNRETGRAKFLNFGIDGMSSAFQGNGLVDSNPLMAEYMSPEQVSGKKTDGRSDIFSLGILLFEMLTGEKPFSGEDLTAVMFKIAKERHPAVRRINVRIPRIVEKVVDKALEKDPDKRFENAAKMVGFINKIIARIDEILVQIRGKEVKGGV